MNSSQGDRQGRSTDGAQTPAYTQARTGRHVVTQGSLSGDGDVLRRRGEPEHGAQPLIDQRAGPGP